MSGKLINYYKILELERSVNPTNDDIKKAYRKLALKYHPDKNGGLKSTAFKRLKEAYDVLSDEDLRCQHDKQLDKNPLLNAEDTEEIGVYTDEVTASFSSDHLSDETSIILYKQRPHISIGSLMRNADLSSDALMQLATSRVEFGLKMLNLPSLLSNYDESVFIELVFSVFKEVKDDPDLLEQFASASLVKLFLKNIKNYFAEFLGLLKDDKEALDAFVDNFDDAISSLDIEGFFLLSAYCKKFIYKLFEVPHIKYLTPSEALRFAQELDIETNTKLLDKYKRYHRKAEDYLLVRELFSEKSFFSLLDCELDEADIKPIIEVMRRVGLDFCLDFCKNNHDTWLECWLMVRNVFSDDELINCSDKYLDTVVFKSIAFIRLLPESSLFKKTPVIAEREMVFLRTLLDCNPDVIDDFAKYAVLIGVEFPRPLSAAGKYCLKLVIGNQYFLRTLNNSEEKAVAFVKNNKCWELLDENCESDQPYTLPRKVWVDLLKDFTEDACLRPMSLSADRQKLIRALNELNSHVHKSSSSEETSDSSDNRVSIDITTFNELIVSTGFYDDLLYIKGDGNVMVRLLELLVENPFVLKRINYVLPNVLVLRFCQAISDNVDLAEACSPSVLKLAQFGVDISPFLTVNVGGAHGYVNWILCAAIHRCNSVEFYKVLDGAVCYQLMNHITNAVYKRAFLNFLHRSYKGEQKKYRNALHNYCEAEERGDTISADKIFTKILSEPLCDGFSPELVRRHELLGNLTRNKVAREKAEAYVYIHSILKDDGSYVARDIQGLPEAIMLSGMSDWVMQLLESYYSKNPNLTFHIVRIVLNKNQSVLSNAITRRLVKIEDKAHADGITPEEYQLGFAVYYLQKYQGTIPGDKLERIYCKIGDEILPFMTEMMTEKLHISMRVNTLVGDEHNTFVTVRINHDGVLMECKSRLGTILGADIGGIENNTELEAVYDKLLELPKEARCDEIDELIDIFQKVENKSNLAEFVSRCVLFDTECSRQLSRKFFLGRHFEPKWLVKYPGFLADYLAKTSHENELLELVEPASHEYLCQLLQVLCLNDLFDFELVPSLILFASKRLLSDFEVTDNSLFTIENIYKKIRGKLQLRKALFNLINNSPREICPDSLAMCPMLFAEYLSNLPSDTNYYELTSSMTNQRLYKLLEALENYDLSANSNAFSLLLTALRKLLSGNVIPVGVVSIVGRAFGNTKENSQERLELLALIVDRRPLLPLGEIVNYPILFREYLCNLSPEMITDELISSVSNQELCNLIGSLEELLEYESALSLLEISLNCLLRSVDTRDKQEMSNPEVSSEHEQVSQIYSAIHRVFEAVKSNDSVRTQLSSIVISSRLHCEGDRKTISALFELTEQGKVSFDVFLRLPVSIISLLGQKQGLYQLVKRGYISSPELLSLTDTCANLLNKKPIARYFERRHIESQYIFSSLNRCEYPKTMLWTLKNTGSSLVNEQLVEQYPASKALHDFVYMSSDPLRYAELINNFLSHQYWNNYLTEIHTPFYEESRKTNHQQLVSALRQTANGMSQTLVAALKEFKFDNEDDPVTPADTHRLNQLFQEKCRALLSPTSIPIRPRLRSYANAVLGGLLLLPAILVSPLIVPFTGFKAYFRGYADHFFGSVNKRNIADEARQRLETLSPEKSTKEHICEKLDNIPYSKGLFLFSPERKKRSLATLKNKLRRSDDKVTVSEVVREWLETRQTPDKDDSVTNQHTVFFPRNMLSFSSEVSESSPTRQLISSLRASKMRI